MSALEKAVYSTNALMFLLRLSGASGNNLTALRAQTEDRKSEHADIFVTSIYLEQERGLVCHTLSVTRVAGLFGDRKVTVLLPLKEEEQPQQKRVEFTEVVCLCHSATASQFKEQTHTM